MNFVAIALLLQLTVALPQRSTLPNPASNTEAVPRQLQKDYLKTWERFLKGKEDQKVLSETDALLKKHEALAPALMIQFYVHQYAGRTAEAERKLEEVLKIRPLDPFVLNALAESAYARNDFVRASSLYKTLLTVERSRPDLETRRQKSLLLAVESLLVKGRKAIEDGDLSAAERFYRDALDLAPGEASLHGELATVLSRQERWGEALSEYQRQLALSGANEQAWQGIALALKHLGRQGESPLPTGEAVDATMSARTSELEQLGRWGPEIARFRQLAASEALTRGEFSWLLYRFFPQLGEMPHNRQILIDVENTGADDEIHAAVGLGLLDSMPNHTFQPSRRLTRRDFAQAMARLSRLLKASPTTTTTKPAPETASAAHARQDIDLAVSLGLLPSSDPANVDLSAPTRGEEAVNAAEKLLSALPRTRP